MHALLAMHAPCDYVHANQLNGSTSRVQRGGKKQTVADFSKWHHLPFIIQYKGKPPPSKGDESYTVVTPVQTHWQRFNRTNMSKTILQCDYISMLTHFFFPEMQKVANSKTLLFKTLPSSGTMGGAHDVTATLA